MDVYETLFLGKEAYITSKFSTQNVRTIIKQPLWGVGPDPLDQYKSIDWKASVTSGGGIGVKFYRHSESEDDYWQAVSKWNEYYND
jgi:hypothetical protein